MKIAKINLLLDTFNTCATALNQKNLIDSASISICDGDGSLVNDPTDDVALDTNPYYIAVSIEKWGENGRTRTETGREELQREQEAVESLLALFELAGLKAELEDSDGNTLHYTVTE